MLNQVVLVGRLVKEVEVKELENGGKVANITLAVPKSYKNTEGVYETDFVDCVLWQGVAESTANYCQKGDLIGIRGRIETKMYENEKQEKTKQTLVVADKVTFLSSKRNDEV